MQRREFMVAAALGAAGVGSRASAAETLSSAARDAWLYGLPLLEMARVRSLAFSAAYGKVGVNRFVHTRGLAGPEARDVTAPNNDTIYSSASIDLTRGPVTFTIPPTGDRYFSAAVLNMFSENDAVLSTRTIGGGGGRFRLLGPDQPGSGPDVIRVATPNAWLLVRTLVDGPDDLPAVHRLQDGLMLEGYTGGEPWPLVARNASPIDYFAALARLLRLNPPPATDAGLFRAIAPLGLTPTGEFDPGRFDAVQLREIDAGVAAAKDLARAFRPKAISGWYYPPAQRGAYGQDYLLRASVALGGLGSLPPSEAIYLYPVGDAGRDFTGDGLHRMHFPAGGLPPVNGFWSLTMYEATSAGQYFFTTNHLQRYAIGDRTRGLTRNPDGSLDIWISRNDPGEGRRGNWLPAPASGPFSMTFRAYLPRPEFLDGRYFLPAVTTG